MPFWPNINQNQLFTPSILLFTSFVVYFLTYQDYAQKSFEYSYLLGFTAVLISLKVYISTFGQLENYFKNHKPFLLGLDILLAGFQLSAAFLGVNHLSQDKYPLVTIQWFLLTAGLYLIQSFLGKIPYAVRNGLIMISFYSICFFLLRQKPFENNQEYHILMQRFIAYLAVGLEFWLMMASIRYFVNLKNKSH